ncbi:MAG: methionyl-tRNA formyltransferase [Chloroflexi bacterium]|nr:methionyl-tRNA formyltransferase [Chloroflexota bacterium]
MAKIVFMGTPEFALPSLKGLMSRYELAAVVTQPDRPAGRRRQLRQSPVKQLALAAGIPVFQPARLRRPAAVETLRRFDADVFVVVAFGQILPQSVLDLPRFGTINVHASLLPRWRGAAPIQAAIRAGDAESGVTIMLLDAGLDTGPLLARQAIELSNDETGSSLHDKLSQMGAELLLRTLPKHLSGERAPRAQDDSQATVAPQISKLEGEIDWAEPAEAIDRHVRAFTPWPGTYTVWKGEELKIVAGRAGGGMAAPGRVVETGGTVAIGTGAGLYLPSELQLPGKKRLNVTDFVNGHRDFVGAQLGDRRGRRPSS